MTVTCWSGPGAGQRGPGLAAASTPWVSGLVSDTSQGPPAPPSVLHKAPPQLGGFSGAGSLRRPKLSPSPGLASVFPMGLLQAAWSPPWRQSGPHWGQELGEASSPGSLSVEQTGLAGQREAPGWHGGADPANSFWLLFLFQHLAHSLPQPDQPAASRTGGVHEAWDRLATSCWGEKVKGA